MILKQTSEEGEEEEEEKRRGWREISSSDIKMTITAKIHNRKDTINIQ